MSRSIQQFQDSGKASEPGARRVGLALAVVLLVAALLRLWRLDGQSLWVDEILTLQAANVGGGLSLREAFWNIQGPLHSTLIHFVSRVSASEVALRAPSAVAGIAAVPVIYLLGRDMVGRRVGLVAAALAAVSPFAVWYSQEVRNYSLVLLFSSVATWMVWRILVGRGRGWPAYVVSLALALYSNLSAFFVALSHNAFACGRLVRNRKLLGRWLVAYVVLLLLMTPMYLGLTRWVDVDNVGDRVVLAPLAEEQDLLRGATTFSPMAVPYAVFTMIYGYSLGPTMTELHTVDPVSAFVRHLWLVLPAGLVALAALVMGFMALLRKGEVARFVAIAVIVPLAGAAVLALMNVKPFNVRYVAVLLPVLLVTLGAGVVSAGPRMGAVLGGLVALFCTVSLVNYYVLPEYGREDMRSVAEYVQANERSGDVVLAPVVRDVFTHYFEGEAESYVLYPGQAGSDEEVGPRVEAGLSGHRRVWFVESRPWHVDPDGRIPAYLESRYERLETRVFTGATVTLYTLGGGAGGPNAASEGS